MIEKIYYIESEGFDPYENLALEEYLLENCGESECILYLWQNSRTVVIGRNQNPWKECRVDILEEDGGHVARRLSGGGAVYHDTGNLNFTFLVRRDNYDLDKQLQVIKNAVNSQGLEAVRSGRNDILIDGKKFSGNAFYKHGDRYYHHGTVMIDVDTEVLTRYLTVSDAKLRSKGVDSVRSRVVNLKELNPAITIDSMKQALISAFGEVYGSDPIRLYPEDVDSNNVKKRMEMFSSWDWLFGRRIVFQNELTGKTEAGEVTLRLQVRSGIITDLVVYSDAMDPRAAERIRDRLKGTEYTAHVLETALKVMGEE